MWLMGIEHGNRYKVYVSLNLCSLLSPFNFELSALNFQPHPLSYFLFSLPSSSSHLPAFFTIF
jgi:hypothetical protein